jgi:hypothetical protein
MNEWIPMDGWMDGWMVCGQETSMILFRLGTGFLRIEVPIFFN